MPRRCWKEFRSSVSLPMAPAVPPTRRASPVCRFAIRIRPAARSLCAASTSIGASRNMIQVSKLEPAPCRGRQAIGVKPFQSMPPIRHVTARLARINLGAANIRANGYCPLDIRNGLPAASRRSLNSPRSGDHRQRQAVLQIGPGAARECVTGALSPRQRLIDVATRQSGRLW